MAESPRPPEGLVPHRGKALFLRRVAAWDAEGIVCVAVIPEGHALVRGGRAASFVGLEVAAQATAALRTLSGVAKEAEEGPGRGYLVGVREARFTGGWLPAGTELRASARRSGSAGPLAVYEVRVASAGVECLVAVMSTYAR
jgi:predicted hotdog family 3-hydroxylacyl-ACP dehydratase